MLNGQLFPCKDGFVALVYTERDWAPLVEMIGDTRLNDDRFATFKSRAENRDAYMSIIEDWCAGQTMSDLYDQFQRAGVPGGPVYSPKGPSQGSVVQGNGLSARVDRRQQSNDSRTIGTG